MIINLRHGKDMITIDLRTKQIRYCKDIDNQGEIIFHDLSNGDVEGYESLWKEDKKLFYSCLKSDLKEFDNINITIKNLKEVILQ